MLLKLLKNNKESNNSEYLKHGDIFNRKNLNYPIGLSDRMENSQSNDENINIEGKNIIFI